MSKKMYVKEKVSQNFIASLVMCLVEVGFDYILKIGTLPINNSMYSELGA